jgi:uncharacterized protein YbcI
MSEVRDDEASSPQKRISRGVVGIYKEYMGRGPTNARTTITDELVITLCEDGLTKAERNLVEAGDDDTVRSIRRKFQQAMSRDIMDLTEQVTGRPARSLLSDHDVVNDIAVETVVLDGPSRSRNGSGEI